MMTRKAEKSARGTVRNGLLAATCALGLASLAQFSSAYAEAPQLPTRPVLTLDVAQRIANAALKQAEAQHTPGVIAVVDDAGEVIVQIRMDHPFMRSSATLAPAKARSAVMFRRPTGVMESAIAGGRPALLSAQGFVMMKGGEPIFVNGELVGGIGVSVDTPDHDEQIAQAGLAVVK
ncbi:heme-binding protein [Acetobacteraceae bacterium ESL0709]|nr:heme-binding protein [Acetobacteraceae bacterium ESL0697]MDF7677904.1 heme-binding protein [Acetobacteraceae bacterium ESL0709]